MAAEAIGTPAQPLRSAKSPETGLVPEPLFEAVDTASKGEDPKPALDAAFTGKKIPGSGDGVAGAFSEPGSLNPSDGSGADNGSAGPPAPKTADASGEPGRGAKGLLSSHALGIFHDTAFKTFFSAWAAASFSKEQAGLYIGLATALFTLPYLLFSVWAGRLADRGDKAKLVLVMKIAELAAALGAAAALAFASPPAMLAAVFALGTRAALMSPAKYSLIPERVPEQKVSWFNGLMEMGTFLSLVVGTAAGGLLLTWVGSGALAAASLLFVPVAALGVWAALGLSKGAAIAAVASAAAPAGAPLGMSKPLFLAALASAFFWYLSSITQMNLFLFGQSVKIGEGAISLLLAGMGVTTGLGAMAAGWVSRKKLELGIVPLGALGVSLLLLDLGLFASGLGRVAFDLLGMGFFAGLFYIPLSAYLQQKSPPRSRGRIIGISNMMTFAAIFMSAGAFYLRNSLLGLSPSAIFVVSGGIALAAFVPVLWKLRAETASLLRDVFGPSR